MESMISTIVRFLLLSDSKLFVPLRNGGKLGEAEEDMRAEKLAAGIVIAGSVILSSAYAPTAKASPIIYNETALNVSAFLNGVEYDNAIVTETAIGDTTGVFMPQPGIWENTISSVRFSLLGHISPDPTLILVSGTILFPLVAFDNQNTDPSNPQDTFNPLAGFAIAGQPLSLGIIQLATHNAAFATYDLRSSIGPVF
jgi:hypothetical protein